MNKIIGITGIMASGKSTLLKKLKDLDSKNKYEFLDLDLFRRNIKELENIKPNIYTNKNEMKKYKVILYKELKNYLSKIKKTIFVEWALIIEDNLSNLFDLIIITDANRKTILKRLKNCDLNKKEIKERLELQLSTEEKLNRISNTKYIVLNEEYSEEELKSIMKGEHL